jgi:alkyl sulfatase BDS1-like metallo-beta-lactamase superfamily hydrolase
MTTEGNSPRPGALPVALREIQDRVRGRSDAVLHEGLADIGVDSMLEHVFQKVVPAAFDRASPAEPKGTIQFVLGSPAGERAWTLTRDAQGLSARAGNVDAPDATVQTSMVNLLRLLASEKTVAAMLESHDLHATGDEALVRALAAWLTLPA